MIGAIGAASELWQALRSQQSTASPAPANPAPASQSSSPGQPATGAYQPTANDGTDAVSKLVTDVRSLLLSLQSGSPTSSSTPSATDPAAQVQSDLDKLASTSGNAAAGAGHHHHHHGGGIRTDGAGSAATPSQLASTDPGLLDAVSKAITAYRSGSAAAA